ncbi:ATP-binding protein [Bacteroides heparinolyticus]|uniref:tetratricopeptide repeat-containing sensor histidine kinase n=1 Tax=Prevotella heparinolytica TaxID=28113 RepID=UPI00359F93B5
MKRTVLILLLSFAVFPLLFAQGGKGKAVRKGEAYPDSLWNVLHTSMLTSEEQVSIYRLLSNWYGSYDTHRTIACLKKGLKIAEKGKVTKEIPYFTRSLGVYYNMLMRYDTAKMYLDQSLACAIKMKDRREEVQAYRCIAHWNYRQNRYIETLDNCMTVLQISEAINDTASRFKALSNIGSLYRELGNLDRAEYYIRKNLKLSREFNMPEDRMAYYELGLIYMERGELDRALEYELKANEWFKVCYKTFEIYSDQAIAKIYTLKREYAKAIAYTEKSIRLAHEFSDTRLETIGMQILSTIYREQQRYAESEAIAFKAWKNDSTMLDIAPELAYNLAFANLQLGNKKKSAYFMQRYAQLLNEQEIKGFHRTMADMEIRYETEKKQQQITSLEKEKRFYIITGVSGALIFLLAFGLLFYRHRLNREKRELAERKVKQLEQEKQLVATLALLDGENAERTRLARDLHDGLGSMLSVIKLHLHGIRSFSALAKADAERLAKAREMLDELAMEFRRMAHNLMPYSLSRYGIKTSLEDFCRSVPMANFQFFGENLQLGSRLEVLIYRCAYELINNAIKHAEATRINVQLTVDERLVSLSVQDDGKGFDPETVAYGAGFTNMHNRIVSHNGKINVYSSPGEGTEITIEIELTT